MEVDHVVANIENLVGTCQTIDGLLMEHCHQPFLGKKISDWDSNHCLLLIYDGLFDILFDKLFPNIIGGGTTLFFHPAKITGRVEKRQSDGIAVITDIRSILVEVAGEHVVFEFN